MTISLLIKASLVLIVLLAFYKLFLEKESFFGMNRAYLLACLLFIFVLPFIPLPELVQNQGYVSELLDQSAISKESEKQSPRLSSIQIEASEPIMKRVDAPVYIPASKFSPIEPEEEKVASNIASLPPVNPVSSTVKTANNNTSIGYWLMLIYYFGVTILSLNLIAQIAGTLFKALKNEDKIKDDQGIIVNVNTKSEPCSFFNFIFINPASYEFETYEQIIAHEKIHVQQKHSLDLLFSELLVIVLWFNPFAWIFRKEVEKNIEYQTDDLLVELEPTEKEDYQINLVKIATYTKPLTITTNYNQSLIKQRIMKMNAKKSNRYSYWKYAFVAPLLFALILVLNKPVMAMTPELDKSTINVEKESEDLSTKTSKAITNENSKKDKVEEVSTFPKDKPEETHSVSGKTVCEKLENAARKGDVEKVRNLLRTVNPDCFPYADIYDYANFEFLKCLISDYSDISIDQERAIIHIEDKVINIHDDIPNARAYEGDIGANNCVNTGVNEIAKAIYDQDVNLYRRLMLNLDVSKLPASVTKEAKEQMKYMQFLLKNGAGISVNNVGVQIPLEILMGKNKTGYSDYFMEDPIESKDCINLTTAAANGDLTEVKKWLKTVDPNCVLQNPGYEEKTVDGQTWKTRKASTPLTAAAREGHLEVAKVLVDAGADVNLHGLGKESPLMAASTFGEVAFVNYLLGKGAELNELSQGWGSALHCAARNGHLELTKFLLEKDIDINAENNGQGSALNGAARHGHLEIMELLIAKGADVNAQTNGQGSALNAAARHGEAEAVELLIAKGADVNIMNNGQGSALNAAARHGHKEVIDLLIKNGADINASNNGQGSALNAAARHGNADVAKLLINKGADLNEMTNGQGSALNAAARHGEIDVMKLLIESGVDVNAENNGQGSALNAAARHGNLEAVKLLLAKGANINAQTNGQGSALNAAARHGEDDVVKLLIEKGADVNLKNNGQGSALNAAARHGNLKAAKLLIAAGANVNDNTNGQGTALMAAVRHDEIEAAKLLLENGADPELSRSHQDSPIEIARKEGKKKLLKLLQQYVNK